MAGRLMAVIVKGVAAKALKEDVDGDEASDY
jgi:hypothetical protein